MAIAIPDDFQDDDLPSLSLRDGVYTCIILKKSWQDYSKIPDKQYLLLEYEIIEGDFKGQKIWDRFNLYHPSPGAQKYSWSLLKKMAMALGQDVISSKSVDIDDIEGEKLKVKVKTYEDDDFGTQVNIKQYMPYREKPVSPPPGGEIESDLPW